VEDGTKEILSDVVIPAILISCWVKPTELITNVLPEAGTFSVKAPLASVEVPPLVPLTVTVAP